MTTMRVAAVQMGTIEKKEENIKVAEKIVLGLAESDTRPDIIVLPEMFTCPYVASNFPIYAEEIQGPTWRAMASLAREAGVYLVAGSIPEQDGFCIYNTSFVFNPNGDQIARHRKVHLFDIDIQGGQRFKESETLTGGREFTTFETKFGTMGLCICYDIRFPEVFRAMAAAGAKMAFVPAAFNMTTGPAHWELTFRARALDNQMYCLGCAPARDEDGPYQSYGHSILTNPWGEVVAQLDETPSVLTAVIDFDAVDAVREQLPLLKHRRPDLYK